MNIDIGKAFSFALERIKAKPAYNNDVVKIDPQISCG